MVATDIHTPGKKIGTMLGIKGIMKNDPEKNPAVPEQEKGRKTGAEYRRNFDTDAEAAAFFQVARERYKRINQWGRLSGILSADFQLCDDKGNKVERDPEVGDHIKIDLPGPGPAEGGSYDWVRIEEIHDTADDHGEGEIDEYFAMVTRPCPDPRSDSDTVAHFYKDSATSTFVVQRVGNEVVASEEGRNELINNEAPGAYDAVRNTAVGGSAMHGMAYFQWKALVKGIME